MKKGRLKPKFQTAFNQALFRFVFPNGLIKLTD